MSEILFPDFYTDDAEFRAAELYWHQLVEELAREHGQNSEWVNWRNHTYADGTPYARDGGNVTMLDLCNYRIGRAISIQQWPPSTEDTSELDMSAWTSRTNAFLEDVILDIQELTLNLEMTQETVATARTLIDVWMDSEVSVAKFGELIRRHIPVME